MLPWAIIGRFAIVWTLWLALLNLTLLLYHQTFRSFFWLMFESETGLLWLVFGPDSSRQRPSSPLPEANAPAQGQAEEPEAPAEPGAELDALAPDPEGERQAVASEQVEMHVGCTGDMKSLVHEVTENR